MRPRAIVEDAPRLVGIPVNVTAPEPTLYVAVAPPGRPAKPTPDSPGASPSVYVTPAALDGPLLVKLTVPLTVLEATAVAGIETVVVTSASGEIAVVADAESGAALAPWLVVVPMVEATVTEPPDAGCVAGVQQVGCRLEFGQLGFDAGERVEVKVQR